MKRYDWRKQRSITKLYSPHGLQFRDNDLFEFSSLNAQLVAITEK